MNLLLLCLLVFTFPNQCRVTSVLKYRAIIDPDMCAVLKVSVLTTLQKMAFNEDFMSIDIPTPIDKKDRSVIIKRGAPLLNKLLQPKATINAVDEMPTLYAWENISFSPLPRIKRNYDRSSWDCGEMVEWMDLGEEYFPRYVRSVKCSCDTCWYASYRCRPRSFPIYMLRKVEKECIPVPEALHLLLEVESGEYVQSWVWDSMYIDTNCDCLPSNDD